MQTKCILSTNGYSHSLSSDFSSYAIKQDLKQQWLFFCFIVVSSIHSLFLFRDSLQYEESLISTDIVSIRKLNQSIVLGFGLGQTSNRLFGVNKKEITSWLNEYSNWLATLLELMNDDVRVLEIID